MVVDTTRGKIARWLQNVLDPKTALGLGRLIFVLGSMMSLSGITTLPANWRSLASNGLTSYLLLDLANGLIDLLIVFLAIWVCVLVWKGDQTARERSWIRTIGLACVTLLACRAVHYAWNIRWASPTPLLQRLDIMGVVYYLGLVIRAAGFFYLLTTLYSVKDSLSIPQESGQTPADQHLGYDRGNYRFPLRRFQLAGAACVLGIMMVSQAYSFYPLDETDNEALQNLYRFGPIIAWSFAAGAFLLTKGKMRETAVLWGILLAGGILLLALFVQAQTQARRMGRDVLHAAGFIGLANILMHATFHAGLAWTAVRLSRLLDRETTTPNHTAGS